MNNKDVEKEFKGMGLIGYGFGNPEQDDVLNDTDAEFVPLSPQTAPRTTGYIIGAGFFENFPPRDQHIATTYLRVAYNDFERCRAFLAERGYGIVAVDLFYVEGGEPDKIAGFTLGEPIRILDLEQCPCHILSVEQGLEP